MSRIASGPMPWHSIVDGDLGRARIEAGGWRPGGIIVDDSMPRVPMGRDVLARLDGVWSRCLRE